MSQEVSSRTDGNAILVSFQQQSAGVSLFIVGVLAIAVCCSWVSRPYPWLP